MLPPSGVIACACVCLLSVDAWLESASRHTPVTRRNPTRVVAALLTIIALCYLYRQFRKALRPVETISPACRDLLSSAREPRPLPSGR